MNFTHGDTPEAVYVSNEMQHKFRSTLSTMCTMVVGFAFSWNKMARMYSGDFKHVAKKTETQSGPFMPLMYKANHPELIRDY